jgi:hypothetical protein
MGIIKTAIMTGGGLYAVNKLAKTTEHRYDSRQHQQQQQYYDPQYQSNSYRPQPHLDQGTREGSQAYYSEYPRQQQYQQQQQYHQDPSQNGQYARGARYAGEEGADSDNFYRERCSNPPPHGAQQGYQQGYQQQRLPEERGQSPVAGLANMAMQFVGSQGGKGDPKSGSLFGKLVNNQTFKN